MNYKSRRNQSLTPIDTYQIDSQLYVEKPSKKLKLHKDAKQKMQTKVTERSVENKVQSLNKEV